MNGLTAPGDETDDAIRSRPERGRALGRLEDPETAASTRSREEHATPPGKHAHENERRSRDARSLGLDRYH